MRFTGSGGPRPALGGAAAAEQLHEYQRLDHVAHAHAPGDVRAQALVGGGGGRGHGGILAPPGQGWHNGAVSASSMASSDRELEHLRKIANALPMDARIIRAVASSTAIETGQSVAELERALTDRQTSQVAPA